MRYIATTATTVENLKIRAKVIQKQQGLPRHAALEAAAREAGYESWYHVQWCFKQPTPACVTSGASATAKPKDLAQGEHDYMAFLMRHARGANVEHFPVSGDVFHAVEIDGMYFHAAGAGVGGPVVVHKTSRLRGYERGWVQLGVSAIYYHTERWGVGNPDDQDPGVWAVCKYSPIEDRIRLADLSDAARFALAYEFGLPIHYPYGRPNIVRPADAPLLFSGDGSLFWLSPAFSSLVAMARTHPRKAAKWKANTYLGDWGKAARKAAGCPLQDDLLSER